jgi:hypothetical protein
MHDKDTTKPGPRMTWVPENDTQGASASAPDGWNIDRLWTTPLGRLTGRVRADRLPGLSELRKALQASTLKRRRQESNSGKSAEARQRLLDELARQDVDPS